VLSRQKLDGRLINVKHSICSNCGRIKEYDNFSKGEKMKKHTHKWMVIWLSLAVVISLFAFSGLFPLIDRVNKIECDCTTAPVTVTATQSEFPGFAPECSEYKTVEKYKLIEDCNTLGYVFVSHPTMTSVPQFDSIPVKPECIHGAYHEISCDCVLYPFIYYYNESVCVKETLTRTVT
jgi:hypothetical protein